MSKRIIRIKETKQKTGLARSTIYAGVKQGSFPHPVKLGVRAVGWVESEIDAWIAARVKESREGGKNASQN